MLAMEKLSFVVTALTGLVGDGTMPFQMTCARNLMPPIGIASIDSVAGDR